MAILGGNNSSDYVPQEKFKLADIPMEFLDTKPESRFQTIGISDNNGSGHYLSFVINPLLKKWFKFDDLHPPYSVPMQGNHYVSPNVMILKKIFL